MKNLSQALEKLKKVRLKGPNYLYICVTDSTGTAETKVLNTLCSVLEDHLGTQVLPYGSIKIYKAYRKLRKQPKDFM